MRIYKFLNEEYGLKALKNRSLKISRICELNDPFELLAPNLSDQKFRKAFQRLKNQLAKNRGLLCFSKKWTNLKAALALYFAWYNFCRVHRTLRITPAMEAGIADHVWGLGELIMKAA